MNDEDQGTEVQTLTAEVVEEIVGVPDVAPVESEDGFLVRPDTGEVVGHVADLPDRPFQVTDDGSAEFVLKLFSEVEGDVVGLRARRDALVAQMDSIISERTRRLAYLHYRFGPDLIRYARSQLNGKSKTKRFAWGSVAFRETKGSNTIVSPEEALKYVETFAPELVKTKRWVGVTEVIAAAQKAEEALGESQEDLGFMKRAEPSESVSITTGVALEGKKR